MRYSPLVQRITGRGAAAWDTHIEARRRQEEGEDIIFLTVGDPDQDPPAQVVEATMAALRRGRTGYSAIVGFPALRQAIAARVARRSLLPCGIDNVAVVPGAQGGLFCAVQCLAGPGDEIIVPEPIYATYEGVVGASGATLVTVPLRPETGFHPDPDAIAAAVTPRTRVMWINTPHNPTGAVFTGDEMAAVAALCRRHDLWLLSDEVYEDLAFARPHVGAWSLPDMAERTVVVSSLSKSHALPGFRLGWVVGPPALTRHLFNLLLSMTYGGPAFIQDGALAALTDDLPEVAALREDYRRRAALMSASAARGAGVPRRAARGRHVRAARRARHRSRLRCVRRPAARCRGGRGPAVRRFRRRAPRVICGSRCAPPRSGSAKPASGSCASRGCWSALR